MTDRQITHGYTAKRSLSRICPSALHAFTLIELLVVISIIAVLISILLPSLNVAKRQAMVLRCMSNLKQIGVGLGNYVVEFNGQYPTPSTISPEHIYTEEYGLNVIDNRPVLYEIAGNRAAELYFCPMVGGSSLGWRGSPADNVVVTPWSHEFYTSIWADRHSVSYNMFFLCNEEVINWSWSNSGNPDTNGDGHPDGPYEWGRSNAAVMADNNVNWPFEANGGYPGDWNKPVWANHSGWVFEAPFRDGNILFGDGHATLRSTLVNYVERGNGTGFYPY